MGTRSTYRVIEKWTDVRTGEKGQNKLVLMYAQYDGYPEGHPLKTAEWLSQGTLVNGLSPKDKGLVFNGAGCLAAQLVAKYKDGPGGYYMLPLNHRGSSGENYTYDIVIDEDRSINFICYEVGGSKRPSFKVLFSGTPQDFIKKYSKKEEYA